MTDKFKEKSFATLVGLLVLGASAIAILDKEQRSDFITLTANVTTAYCGWIVGARQVD